MMCDVDHFKSINDRYGHAVGDEVLRHVAHTVRAHLRDADALGRIGGEEFLVVLDSADLEQARAVAERLRQAVSGTSVLTGNRSITVTISLGVAQSHAGEEDWATVIGRADEGLYAAKRTGRDRVIVSEGGTPRLLADKNWHQQI
jgi:diguanylate cyclase (GGDEF)-like protein